MAIVGKRYQRLQYHDWQRLRRPDVSDTTGDILPPWQRITGIEPKRCRWAEFWRVVSLAPVALVLP